MEAYRITDKNIGLYDSLLDADIRQRFMTTPYLHGIGTAIDGEACGIIIYSLDEETASVIWLAVSDKHRRKGVGTFLVGELCRGAYSDAVLVMIDLFIDEPVFSDEMYLFCDSLAGFTLIADEGAKYYIDQNALEKSALGKYASDNKFEAKSIYALSRNQQAKLMEKAGITYDIVGDESKLIKELCLYSGEYSAPETVVYVSCGTDAYEDSINISYVWTAAGREKSLMSILVELYRLITAKPRKWRGITFATINVRSDRFVRHIFPEYIITGRCISAMWDMDTFPDA